MSESQFEESSTAADSSTNEEDTGSKDSIESEANSELSATNEDSVDSNLTPTEPEELLKSEEEGIQTAKEGIDDEGAELDEAIEESLQDDTFEELMETEGEAKLGETDVEMTDEEVELGESVDERVLNEKVVKESLYSIISFASDFSNKMLMFKQDGVEVLKGRPSQEDIEEYSLVFVLDENAVHQINNNEYHLDDLQQNIARAIGVEPERIRISFLLEELRNTEGYTKVSLSKMAKTFDFESIVEVPGKKPHKHIIVETLDASNNEKRIDVSVRDYTYGYQWLGGYRNKKTGTLYCNAVTQTYPRKRGVRRPVWDPPPALVSRNLQTQSHKDKAINVLQDHSTQVWRLDHYIPADTDLIVTPGVYKPFDPSYLHNAAIVIQKHWRGYCVRKKQPESEKVLDSISTRKYIFKRLVEGTQVEDFSPNMVNSALLNLIFPYRREHFFKLHWLLKKFKQDTRLTFEDTLFEAPKKANVFMLMDKEVERVRAFQKQRVAAKFESIKKNDKVFLEKVSAPRLKLNIDKGSIYVTEDCVMSRCRELKELLVLFKREDTSIEQRIEILMLFKKLLESYEEFDMKEELLSLIDRECIMLSSGVHPKYLKILRKRCEQIIFNFIQHSFVQDKLENESRNFQTIFRCRSCSKYKPIALFPIVVNQRTIRTCNACSYKHVAAHGLCDLAPYITILKRIRQKEYSLGCVNPYAIILQPQGVQYLVEKIWNSKSAITSIPASVELRLPRWDRTKIWAPWNCIALTEEEAERHERVEDINARYAPQFHKVINLKHLICRTKFKQFFEIENALRRKWANFSETQFYASMSYLLSSYQKAGETFFQKPPAKKYSV